jgi:hypothetical protein
MIYLQQGRLVWYVNVTTKISTVKNADRGKGGKPRGQGRQKGHGNPRHGKEKHYNVHLFRRVRLPGLGHTVIKNRRGGGIPYICLILYALVNVVLWPDWRVVFGFRNKGSTFKGFNI